LRYFADLAPVFSFEASSFPSFPEHFQGVDFYRARLSASTSQLGHRTLVFFLLGSLGAEA